jgi:predicted DNA-binding transcriptional regulator AlpA
MSTPPETPLLSARQIGKLLQVCPRTILYWEAQRMLPPSIVIGGQQHKTRRWKESEILEWIERHKEQYTQRLVKTPAPPLPVVGGLSHASLTGTASPAATLLPGPFHWHGCPPYGTPLAASAVGGFSFAWTLRQADYPAAGPMTYPRASAGPGGTAPVFRCLSEDLVPHASGRLTARPASRPFVSVTSAASCSCAASVLRSWCAIGSQ